jgi:hypothetical protein
VIDTARSWLKENSTLVYFLVAQAIAIGAAGISVISYMVRLETRVNTLEIRGSPHLNDINNRLTVLESTTKDNKERLEKVVDVMTRELHIAPTRTK